MHLPFFFDLFLKFKILDQLDWNNIFCVYLFSLSHLCIYKLII